MTRIFAGLAAALALAIFATPAQAASVAVTDNGDSTFNVEITLDGDVLSAELQLNFTGAVDSSSAVVNGGLAQGGLCSGFICALNNGAQPGLQRLGIVDISATLGFPTGPIGGGAGTHLLGVMTLVTSGDFSITLDPVFGQDNGWENAGDVVFASSVPEPASLVLIGLGLAALSGIRRGREV